MSDFAENIEPAGGAPINLLMVGLPGSGKTTFLAGIFHTLNNAPEGHLALRDLPLRRRVTAPAYHPIPGESLLGLNPGERDTVHDLLYGLLLPSGNDAAVTHDAGRAIVVGGIDPKRNHDFGVLKRCP